MKILIFDDAPPIFSVPKDNKWVQIMNDIGLNLKAAGVPKEQKAGMFATVRGYFARAEDPVFFGVMNKQKSVFHFWDTSSAACKVWTGMHHQALTSKFCQLIILYTQECKDYMNYPPVVLLFPV